MRQYRFQPEFLPGPCWGSLRRSLKPPNRLGGDPLPIPLPLDAFGSSLLPLPIKIAGCATRRLYRGLNLVSSGISLRDCVL